MKLVLERLQMDPAVTIGSLSVDGEFECWTLEDTVREGPKVPGQTAIPYGLYGVDITYSPHFARELPLLVGVPNFAGVRIHPGNTAADTEGCILVGLDRGAASIGRSRDAFHALFPKIQQAHNDGQLVTIEVTKPQPGDVVA